MCFPQFYDLGFMLIIRMDLIRPIDKNSRVWHSLAKKK